VVWAESLAYVRIIWPALVFGIIIAAAARAAIPQDWFASWTEVQNKSETCLRRLLRIRNFWELGLSI
jgi:uncharacterized membrane protein YraQ (UPF0718 family)